MVANMQQEQLGNTLKDNSMHKINMDKGKPVFFL